ncbi:MAG TPA: bi-domain-containing oxidoreductase [Terriglobales bacterium]|nr:bi-domain-containing oxidoreductase [Terriglobales bacterium]
MKQVLQSARTGKIEVAEVPAPRVQPGCALVRIAASLVSAGTERASAEFASKSILQKAQSRPDLVREVVAKVRRDGFLSAAYAVRSRLDQPLALGYSSAGTVVSVGEGITDITPGDRVAGAGANYAVHAEFACVPRMLLARIPSADVLFDAAAFTTLGAVAIHGVRTATVNLGDTVAVIGLGLLGQLTVQILKAAGCRVIGFDLAQERADLALKSGTLAVSASEDEFRDLCLQHSAGHGVDAVLITAETPSSGPVNLASQIARDRAVVCAVGTVGMDLQRKLYYEKELDFRISRSYGPGRYDAAFEQKGRDFPIGYVRWSETRNMEAFLQLLADGKVEVRPLISHSFEVEDAEKAYELITGKTRTPYLGVLIRYGHDSHEAATQLELKPRLLDVRARALRVGVLGAGNFSLGTLIPAIQTEQAVTFEGLCAANVARGNSAARKFGFAFCTSDEDDIFSNNAINLVVIASRHHGHARQVVKALESGKHVFCEKPLCLNEEELESIRSAHARAGNMQLMVGFNRRFSAMGKQMKSFLNKVRGPFAMHYRINAGMLPKDHWINDPEQGGGRILGEVCHFVDFLSFLCGGRPITVQATPISRSAEEQDVMVHLDFSNGSKGTIHYLCSGDRVFGKERVEVFGGGAIAVLDDFRRLELIGHGRKQVFRSWLRQDKGHRGEWQEFARALCHGTPSPISFDDICATTLATIRIAESVRAGQPQHLPAGKEGVSAVPLVS